MNKLTKAQAAERASLLERSETAYATLKEKVEAFNAARLNLWGEVQDAETAYNEVVIEAQNWRDGIVSDLENYHGEKSDKWQESDKGQAQEAWRGEFENVELEEINIDEPDEIELDAEDNPLTELENVPEGVEE